MGVANAQRSLQYIRTIAEFISQPEYEMLIPIFGIVNEPLLGDIGIDPMTRL
jgi:glucan 1,3-beta-glucosidase